MPHDQFQIVGRVEHLHELNDAWIQNLPVGTLLYTNARTRVGSDGLSVEDRAAMDFQLIDWVNGGSNGS